MLGGSALDLDQRRHGLLFAVNRACGDDVVSTSRDAGEGVFAVIVGGLGVSKLHVAAHDFYGYASDNALLGRAVKFLFDFARDLIGVLRPDGVKLHRRTVCGGQARDLFPTTVNGVAAAGGCPAVKGVIVARRRRERNIGIVGNAANCRRIGSTIPVICYVVGDRRPLCVKRGVGVDRERRARRIIRSAGRARFPARERIARAGDRRRRCDGRAAVVLHGGGDAGGAAVGVVAQKHLCRSFERRRRRCGGLVVAVRFRAEIDRIVRSAVQARGRKRAVFQRGERRPCAVVCGILIIRVGLAAGDGQRHLIGVRVACPEDACGCGGRRLIDLELNTRRGRHVMCRRLCDFRPNVISTRVQPRAAAPFRAVAGGRGRVVHLDRLAGQAACAAHVRGCAERRAVGVRAGGGDGQCSAVRRKNDVKGLTQRSAVTAHTRDGNGAFPCADFFIFAVGQRIVLVLLQQIAEVLHDGLWRELAPGAVLIRDGVDRHALRGERGLPDTHRNAHRLSVAVIRVAHDLVPHIVGSGFGL